MVGACQVAQREINVACSYTSRALIKIIVIITMRITPGKNISMCVRCAACCLLNSRINIRRLILWRRKSWLFITRVQSSAKGGMSSPYLIPVLLPSPPKRTKKVHAFIIKGMFWLFDKKTWQMTVSSKTRDMHWQMSKIDNHTKHLMELFRW